MSAYDAVKFLPLLTVVFMAAPLYNLFGLQPRIEALLTQVQSEQIPPAIAEQLLPGRARRKELAGFCLFFVVTLVLLGLQVFVRFDPRLTGLLILLAAVFSWRVYKTNIPYGWI